MTKTSQNAPTLPSSSDHVYRSKDRKRGTSSYAFSMEAQTLERENALNLVNNAWTHMPYGSATISWKPASQRLTLPPASPFCLVIDNDDHSDIGLGYISQDVDTEIQVDLPTFGDGAFN